MTIEEANEFAKLLQPGDIIHFNKGHYVFTHIDGYIGAASRITTRHGVFMSIEIAPGNRHGITVEFVHHPIRRVVFQ